MISVIIISFNTRELVIKCLTKLYESTEEKPEIIVVDNGSKDGTVPAVQKSFKEVKLIANKENRGFGAANNQGMKIARGEYILLLNSDCFVEKATLADLVKTMTQKQRIGVLGCKLLNADGSVQQSWGYFPTLRRIIQMLFFVDNFPGVRKYIDSIHVRDISRYNQKQAVDWVTGAMCFLKREVWEKTGGFDPHFFMYGEEIEWQFRIKMAGYEIWFDPNTTATHLLGASSPNRAPAVVGEMQGWKYWFTKYCPVWQQKTLRLAITLGSCFRIIVKPGMAKYYRQALADAWK